MNEQEDLTKTIAGLRARLAHYEAILQAIQATTTDIGVEHVLSALYGKRPSLLNNTETAVAKAIRAMREAHIMTSTVNDLEIAAIAQAWKAD